LSVSDGKRLNESQRVQEAKERAGTRRRRRRETFREPAGTGRKRASGYPNDQFQNSNVQTFELLQYMWYDETVTMCHVN